MTILDAIKMYFNQCENIKKLEPLTLKAYALDLKQFSSFATKTTQSINEIDKTLILNYIDYISAKYAAKSLKRKVASLKAFFNYLELEDIIVVTPFRKIRLQIKEAKRIPKALTLFEMEKLLAHLYLQKAKTISAICDMAIFELFFATGIRISELCNINISDIHLDAQRVWVKGKGNKERVAFIASKYALSALKHYIDIRPNNGSKYLFLNRLGNKISSQSVRFFVRALGRKVLNKPVTPHMLRHTFATLLPEEGVDITYIKSFLGHASIATTQIYAASTTYHQRQVLTSLHAQQNQNLF